MAIGKEIKVATEISLYLPHISKGTLTVIPDHIHMVLLLFIFIFPMPIDCPITVTSTSVRQPNYIDTCISHR